MTVTIKPTRAVGTVAAPPSKSMAHRYLICAALSDRACTVDGVAFSKDITATLNGLAAMGAKLSVENDTVTVLKPVGGVQNAVIDCCESGSTLRFLLPLAAALGINARFIGAKRLFERPLDVYSAVFAENGVNFSVGEDYAEVSGKLTGNAFAVRGDISSQFITGLIFALVASGGGTITVTTRLESAPYISLTLQALAVFGVKIERNENSFTVYGDSVKAATATVEGDYSNAAFFFALNTLGGNVTVTGLQNDSLQGDAVAEEYLKKIGLSAPVLDITDCPDLAPVLFATAAAKKGATFLGTQRLKIKESDRGEAMATELRKFGVETEISENEIRVFGGAKTPAQPLYCHNDHRIAMALSVLATVYGGTLCGAECVSKSFPDFFERLSAIGIEVVKDET